ncbi:MAG: 3-hydroxyacyl-CoA dehydrogenase NAD-binding domain-containing protein, partial [Acidimicrobiales bacterium]
MTRPDPESVRRVAVVGTGVIGGGWAAHFLRMGLDVSAFDPAPGAEDRLRRMVDGVWPTLARHGLAPAADPARLPVATNPEDPLVDAEFVQESTREDLTTKIAVMARIDAAAPIDAVIASSTSGFAMTALQRDCVHP